MPLTEREYDLEAEYDRLDERVAEFAQEYADAENGSTYQQIAAQRARPAQDHRSGAAWALGFPDGDLPGAAWDIDTVTLGSPTKGEMDRVDDAVDTLECSRQNATVAIATVDAPYVEHDPANIGQAALHKTIGAVARLHPEYVAWVDERIDALRQGGDTGKSFMASVATATSATSQTENG
jgi:hypothetical protein